MDHGFSLLQKANIVETEETIRDLLFTRIRVTAQVKIAAEQKQKKNKQKFTEPWDYLLKVKKMFF